MMKKIKKTIIYFSAVVFLLACTKATNKTNNATDLVGNDSMEVNIDDELSKVGDELMKQEGFGELKIGLKYSEVVAMLGEPDEKSETAIWGTDGEYHQRVVFTQKGIEIDFMGSNEASKEVNNITITQPSDLATQKNIRIGSTAEEVFNAYGEAISKEFSDSTSIVAGSVYGGMVFTIENKKVKTIFIGSSAE